MKYADYKYNTDNRTKAVFAVCLFVCVFVSTHTKAQLFGGGIKSRKKIVIPATITLGQDQKYFVASVYDTDYLPYTTPTAAASTATVAADGTTESVTVNVQGTITTTGITVLIPVIATGSGTLPAYSTSIDIPGSLTEDGIGRTLTFSWVARTYTSSTKTITATIAAVGGTLNVKKLDINAGIGNDYLGYLLGQFTYPYDNAGAATGYQVRDIPGIPDKMFGKFDIGNSTTYEHQFLYLPITAEDGNVWLSNNLGADYAKLNSSNFNITAQATAYNDSRAYGSLFQWGRCPDGHELINWSTETGIYDNGSTQSITDTPTSALFIAISGDWRSTPNDALWATEASANNPCPSGFRVPTQAEQTGLVTAAGITNYSNATTSKLKFSVAGMRNNGDGSILLLGNSGYYWNCSVSGINAGYRSFLSSITRTNFTSRTLGYTVRCLKN